jgi:IS5 family transposase
VKTKTKLYALHAPEVERISKGKSRYPYAFRDTVGCAVTARGGLVVGARSILGDTYGGDKLGEQLEEAEILSGEKPCTIIVDLGYRGISLEGVEILHRGKPKRLTCRQCSWAKRRQPVELIIGRLRGAWRLRRNRLKDALRDASYVLGCVAGYNVHWITRF